MSDTVILTWNVTNWITVFLMAAIGFVVVNAVSAAWKSRTNAGD